MSPEAPQLSRSHLSLAFATRTVCHCMFENAPGPPQARGGNAPVVRQRAARALRVFATNLLRVSNFAQIRLRDG